MEIEINIEKKHLYYLMCLIIFFFIVETLASFDPSIPYHETLYTNSIEPKNGDIININQPIIITENVDITGNLNMVSGKFKGKRPFGVLRFTNVNSGTCNSKCEAGGYLNCMAGFTSDTTVSGDRVDGNKEVEYLLQYRECSYSLSSISNDDDDFAWCFCNNYLD